VSRTKKIKATKRQSDTTKWIDGMMDWWNDGLMEWCG